MSNESKLKSVILEMEMQDSRFSVALGDFCIAFPSLDGIPEVVAQIWNVVTASATQRDFDDIESAIEAGSENGEWPAKVWAQNAKYSSIVIGNYRRQSQYDSTSSVVVITPYCGDRHFKVYPFKDFVRVVIDYTERPSLTAARSVIESLRLKKYGGTVVLAEWDGEPPFYTMTRHSRTIGATPSLVSVDTLHGRIRRVLDAKD